MQIKIITTFENAMDYLSNVKENNSEAVELWTKHMI